MIKLKNLLLKKSTRMASMGSVVPLKKSVNSAYLDLKNLVADKLIEVENLIEIKLKSKVDLINKMSSHLKKR